MTVGGNAIQPKRWSYRKMVAKGSREKKTRREKERKKRANLIMQEKERNAENLEHFQLFRIPDASVLNAMHTNTPRGIVEKGSAF